MTGSSKKWGVAIVMLGCVSVLWLWKIHGSSATPAPPTAPTVLVETRLAVRKDLVHRVVAVGDVSPGKTIGVSFQRAGQVTFLDALPGRHVARGSVLARLAPDPATVQAYEQAVTSTQLTEREWHRQQELFKLQLGTQSQVDSAEKAFRDARGSAYALQAVGGSGESEAKAPFDGVIVSAAVSQGDRVTAGAPILQLGHVDVLRVQIGIEPAQSRLVHVGAYTIVEPIGAVGQDATPIAGTVAEIQDLVDPKTLLVNAIVMLRADALRSVVPGMKVRASIDVGHESALAVPRDAVLTDELGAYVFQVQDGKAHRVAVTAGMESDGLVAIAGLTEPQLPVVVRGNYELDDGVGVRDGAPPARPVRKEMNP